MRIALLLLLLLMLLRWCLFAAPWEFAADLILLYLVFTGVQGNGTIPGRLCLFTDYDEVVYPDCAFVVHHPIQSSSRTTRPVL